MTKKNYKFLLATIFLTYSITSCNSGGSTGMESDKANATAVQDTSVWEESADEIEEALVDSVDGEKVSHECAIVSYHLDEMISDMENIRSPHQLMRFRAKYPRFIASLDESINQLEGEEQAAMRIKVSDAKEKYVSIGRQYEVEASGVLARVNELLSYVQKIDNKEDMKTFIDNNYSTIKVLDIIHLSANQQSSEIKDIKRNARKLRDILTGKREHFGI